MPTLTKATLSLFIYEGLSSNAPSSPQYTLTKEKIEGQNGIVFEIAELVRDYLEHDFDNDYNAVTRWVKASTTLYDEGGSEFAYGSPVVEYFIAKDGYGYFEDEINPQLSRTVLQTSNVIYLKEGEAGRIPVFAEDTTIVSIDGSNISISDNGDSSQKIQYPSIPSGTSSVTVGSKTIKVETICEPKYTPYKVTYVNKYGAYQDLWFFLRSDQETAIKDKRYFQNTINLTNLTYATNSGQEKRYDIRTSKKINLNTGYVNEEVDNDIQELLQSENVWIRYENKTLPTIPTLQSHEHKTHLNDRLINYTISFDFAFEKINNIR